MTTAAAVGTDPSFVTAAGAALLEGYTRLPKTVQGTLSPSQGGVSPLRTDTSTNDVATFRSLIPHLKAGSRTLVVAQMSLLSTDGTLGGGAGTPVKGPKHVQGVFVPVHNSVPPRLVGTAISSEDVGGHPPGTPMLISFLASDDQSTPPVPFGTQTTLMPLAPVASYLEWIWGGLIPRALIACPNGAFLLEHSGPRRTEEQLRKSRMILDNVLRHMSIVVDARQQQASADGGTGMLCRGASTVLVVLDGVADLPLLASFCQSLGTGPYQDHAKMLESGGTFFVSSGLLDIQEPSAAAPSLARVRKAALSAFPGRPVSVKIEPLVEWKSSPVTIEANINVRPLASPSDGSGLANPIESHDTLHAGALGLKVVGRVSLRDLRPPKPGETPRAVEKQIERIIDNETKKAISEGPPEGWKTRHDLDAVSAKLADTIRTQLSTAGVYNGEAKVVTVLKQEKTPAGRHTRMPSGALAVIPQYATTSLAPRLAAVLGVLPSLGSTVRFFNWNVAEHNGIPLR